MGQGVLLYLLYMTSISHFSGQEVWPLSNVFCSHSCMPPSLVNDHPSLLLIG